MEVHAQQSPNVAPERINFTSIFQLKRILGELKPHKNLVITTQVTCVLSLCAGSIIPFVIKYLIESIENNHLETLLWAPWIGLGLTVALAVFQMIRNMSNQYVSILISQSLQKRIFKLFIHQNISDSFKMPLGEKVSRITFDIHWLVQGASLFLSESLYMPLLIVACLSIMFYLDFRLALITLILSPLSLVVSKLFSQRIRKSSRFLQEENALFSRQMVDSLKGFILVKTFCREEKEKFSLEVSLKKLARLNLANTLWGGMLGATITIGNALIFCFVAWSAFYFLTESKDLAISDMIAFASVMFFFFGEISRLGGAITTLTRAAVSCDRIYDLLDNAAMEGEGNGREIEFKNEIVFKDVEFGYNENSLVLKGVDLTIQRGERIALMGMSGTGKTTLMRLLVGLLQPTNGAVYMDGVDVKTIKPNSLRKSFCYSPQMNILFHSSVADNIRYSRPEAEMDDVLRVSKLACMHDFVKELPGQYDALVGEDGAQLSEGQRQRIAIARALLRDAPIIILDESSSHVDIFTEQKIYNNIMELSDKTVIVISHRPSVLRRVDRILSLKDGKVSEVKNMLELIKDDHYTELLDKFEFIH